MTDTSAGHPTADDLWRWLLTCTDCGDVHEFRQLDGERVHNGWTWASPVDGHGYATRDYLGSRLHRLRTRWNAEQLAATPPDHTP